MKPKCIHLFRSPELTGPDGESVELSDALEKRLRKGALQVGPSGESIFENLQPELRRGLLQAVLQIRGKAVEYGVILSPEGRILHKKRGSKNRVPIESHWLEGNVFIHNHPEDGPLGYDDIEAIFRSNVASVWAVTSEWLYGIFPGSKGYGSSALADFRLHYEHLSRATFAVIRDLCIHDQSLMEILPQHRHGHAVLLELAAAGFVRYCRVSHATARKEGRLRL